MRIDAHHHLWDLNAVHYPWLMEPGAARFFGDPTAIQRDYLVDEFRRDAQAQGISASVHIQVGAADGLAEARWVQSVADANPGFPAAQVAYCDLTADDLPEQLGRLQALPTVRGVRQIVGRAPGEDARTGTNALLQDPRFLEGLREVGRRGLSFDLQLIPDLMPGAVRVLSDAPDTPVALCHAGSPHDRSADGLRDWATRIKTLSALPHVTCKLSGLGMFEHGWSAKSVAPIVEICLEQFGPDRCMWGSNFPVDSLYANYATTFQRHWSLVPDDMQNAVFGGTAARFYGLT
ncbi:amidohydrolase family protein [Shimia biformata]|uniref:amidohydrolase family protein n=1 Tax=Shimia biformata TaxID=1294299 RepID=UPI0019528712|nr:amidohydrolase family protein [Shimia biformata]